MIERQKQLMALLLLVVVAGALFLYRMYRSETPDQSVEFASRAAEAQALFEELNGIAFDQTFLNSDTIGTLINFYQQPTYIAPGRQNPFDPASDDLVPNNQSRDLQSHIIEL